MKITRADDPPKSGDMAFKGTYGQDGRITGTSDSQGIQGEWRDSTGSGTMYFLYNKVVNGVHDGLSFEGEWERKTGKGAKKGKWEGRCVKEP